MPPLRQRSPLATRYDVPSSDPSADDARLAAGARSGDGDALAAMYALHGAAVYASAHRLARNAADAEDVVQELFASPTQSLSGYDPLVGPLRPWLRQVAVRLTLMRLRSQRRRREVDVAGVAELLARPETPVERLTIEDALARLGEDQRQVFLLKEVEGYQHREIAELLSISVANSEIRLFRARQALRAMLRSSR